MSTKLIELGKVTAETKAPIPGDQFDNDTFCVFFNRFPQYIA